MQQRADRRNGEIGRPVLRYYGGKWRLAPWIIGFFPPHSCYVEPFAGGGSVLLRKTPSKFEVLNDLDHDVVNFFEVLRTRTDDLIRAIELTPYAREELRRARYTASADPLERARCFYVRCWQSFGSGTGQSSTGWRYQIGAGDDSRASAIGSWNKTKHLWAVVHRLKQVQIECGDYSKIFERYDGPETVFYLDPPYVHATRYHSSDKKGYRQEMTDADHAHLADLARRAAGYVLISGYPSGLYDELYAGWQCQKKEAKDLNAASKIECLWLSPRTVEALAGRCQTHTQLSLMGIEA